jgi:TPR repeat protein
MAGILNSLSGLFSNKSRLDKINALQASGNSAEAFRLLAALAKRGNAEAQYRVGKCYLEADGVPPSRNDAAHWLTLAANGGHLKAQSALAGLYIQGMVHAGREASELGAPRRRRRPTRRSGTGRLFAHLRPRRDAQSS